MSAAVKHAMVLAHFFLRALIITPVKCDVLLITKLDKTTPVWLFFLTGELIFNSVVNNQYIYIDIIACII